ncbi:hypothetical protein SBA3_2630008 [Candidatus Sulfopaludibacter sp. SbA3]|nr:hypothetical protein SBA3_2630008 [Candidatus Sulfopaludibacter sp. SbA3]
MRCSVIKARSLWFIDTLELNPRGKAFFPDIVEALEEKYEFERVPKSSSDKNPQGGFEFGDGIFARGPDDWIDVSLIVFSDGLAADTRSSTKDSNAFLNDLLSFSEKFGFENTVGSVQRKAYLSELTVRTEKSLRALHPNLLSFAQKVRSLIPDADYGPFEPWGITFGSDQTTQLKPGPFEFARKVNIPFAENRYYSQAPVQTEDHILLLEEFENLFLG